MYAMNTDHWLYPEYHWLFWMMSQKVIMKTCIRWRNVQNIWGNIFGKHVETDDYIPRNVADGAWCTILWAVESNVHFMVSGAGLEDVWFIGFWLPSRGYSKSQVAHTCSNYFMRSTDLNNIESLIFCPTHSIFIAQYLVCAQLSQWTDQWICFCTSFDAENTKKKQKWDKNGFNSN